jgi:hypothetical protein
MHIKEVEDHKRNIVAQLALCQHQLNISQDGRWIDRQIELEKVLATIDQTLVIEHGLERLFAVLKVRAIDDTVKQILDSDSEQGN